MNSFEPKKLALIRILQILEEHSDIDHPLTQEEMAARLEQDYGIALERKAVGRNLSLLKEAGYEIESTHSGSYLAIRAFEEAELRMLIDGVLSSRHITARHSADLIERLCSLSNRYFRAHVKNIYSVNEWSKTDNQSLFYNIALVDEAIERKMQIAFDYNRYGIDKKLHKTTAHTASPYQLILHNQRYYLMALNEKYQNIIYYRLDRITGMRLLEDKALTDIRSVEGYENGIDYKDLAASRPYMFADKAEFVEFIADAWMIDQVIDWFGYEVKVSSEGEDKIRVRLKVSPGAMEHWAMQYVNYVEVVRPESLRERIKVSLKKNIDKYTLQGTK